MRELIKFFRLSANMLKKARSNLVSEIKLHSTLYGPLAVILVVALFVRVYRTEALLEFYYDQGRDALVIWKLWHNGKLFLVGPVTGLAGIFLGPLYYYIIAPFYLIGGGNPVIPAYFLTTLSVLAIITLYYLGWQMVDRTTGLVAAIIVSFSFYIILFGRWLSNPNLILLTSTLLLWSMWRIVDGKNKSGKWWIAVALLIGASLQFEAASAVFYLPLIGIFAWWQRRKLSGKKTIFAAIGILLLTLLPQILFNFRHDNILFNNFKKVLVDEKSFRLTFWEVLETRINYFWTVFSSKIFPGKENFAFIFAFISLLAIITTKRTKRLSDALKLLLLFIGMPILGITLFQGNFGNIFDYYMSGYYMPIILLFSIGMGLVWKKKVGKYIVFIFFIYFLTINGQLILKHLSKDIHKPTHITLGNELQAVDWILNDAGSRGEFNVDAYVPPVISHSYDYLFLWQTTRRCGDNLCEMKLEQRVPLLYTPYEVDPPYPNRLEAWLERQEGIGAVESEARFGGITVQRRKRL